MSRSIDFYLDLVTSEHKGSPKFNAALAVLLQKMDDVSAIADDLVPAFDLDLAVGVQLDRLGEIIGISRALDFQPNYGISPILSDSYYRILLKASIGRNQWDGVQDSLYPLWRALFPTAIMAIHDNHWMDMDVFVQFPRVSSIFVDLIEQGFIVPKPQGVLQHIYVGPTFPFFGADYDDPYVSGADRGHAWHKNLNQYPQFGADYDDALISGPDKGFAYTP